VSPYDHYYGRTALLAALGLRSRMRRLNAVSMLALSVVPLLLLASSMGPHGPMRYTAGLVTIGGIVMAWRWWRLQWPSRTESWMIVAVGGLGIIVTCLMLTNAMIGLLGMSIYSMITSYAAFLHSRRVLLLTLGAGEIVVLYLAVRVGIADVLLGVAGAIVVTLVLTFTSLMCRMAVRLIDPDDMRHPNEIEPLTGLLNREAFDIAAATMFGAASRHDDQYLVVVAVSIDDMALLTDMEGTHGTLSARVAVGHALRETIRHKVPLAHISDSDFLIADVFKTNDPSPLVDRIRGSINTTPMRLTTSIGSVCSPLRPAADLPAEEVVDTLVTLASRAMQQSRDGGGNLITSAYYPTLTCGGESAD
jgi:GGDEF domain-containing protein